MIIYYSDKNMILKLCFIVQSLPVPSADIEPFVLGKKKTVNLNYGMKNLETDEEHHISA